MRTFLLVGLVFLLVGCSTWSPDASFEQNSLKEQSIINTKKQEMLLNDQRVLVLVTYLNDIDHPSTPKNNAENFIVAFYVGDTKADTAVIKSVMLNDSDKGIAWSALQPKDALLELLPIANSWSRYFHIKAPLSSNDTLNLLIESDPSTKVSLTFQKEQKN